MKALIVLVLLLTCVCADAQSVHEWEKYLSEVMSAEDMESAEWEDCYETLCELAQHPLDLNHASREDLEQLSFLSSSDLALRENCTIPISSCIFGLPKTYNHIPWNNP